VRGGEVNVGVVGIVNATALAVRIVGSGEVGEVASDPGVDAQSDDDECQHEVDDQPAEVGAVTLLD
jgi:hypothetical protein